jgi:Uma2 family endonuclease
VAGCLLFLEHDFEVPMDVRTLDDFRRWALSEEFPESGRIDYINGNIEIDLSPEPLFTHNAPKVAIVAKLVDSSDDGEPGYVFCTRMRFSSVPGDLSTEPDVFFLSYDALDSARAKLIPEMGGGPDDYIEIEGAPDLVVEIVTKTSLARDTKRLPGAYFKTGVREYWLIDGRADELSSVIHGRGKGRFVALERDTQGFQRSDVIKRRLRLDRQRDQRGFWQYDLRVKR